MDEETAHKIQQEGYDAMVAGKRALDNPYPPTRQGPKSRAWTRGYNMARTQRMTVNRLKTEGKI